MSLYIGNLPPGIRRDNIERVFIRFGRCTVRLLDGYAFAVYDFRPNAEKALRALKGRRVFGAPISLFWSNQQPKTSQRFARGGRPFEMHRRRNFNRVDNLEYRRRGSDGRQNSRMSYPEPDSDSVRLKSSDMHDEHESFKHNHEGHHDQGDEFHDINGSVNPNQEVDGNRWGELVDTFSNEVQRENGGTFDRYEPDLGPEIRGENENEQTPHSDHYRNEASVDRTEMEQLDDVVRDHQLKHSPRRRKPYRSKHQGDDERKSDQEGDELGIRDSRPRPRLSSKRHSASDRQREANKRSSVSGKRERLSSRNSTIKKELRRDKRKGSGGKRCLERERDTSGGNHSKKARRSLYSVRRAGWSHSASRSSDSVAGSGSHSRSSSLSPVSQSSLSSSRPKHKSRRSRSVSVNSRSKSSSSSHTSLSLSVSLGRPLPSPPNKAEVDTAGSLGTAKSPVPQETLNPDKQDVHGIPSVSPMLDEVMDEGGIRVDETGNSAMNHAILGASSEIKHISSPVSENECRVPKEMMIHEKQQFSNFPSIRFLPNACTDNAGMRNNEVGNGDINHVPSTVSSEIKTPSLPPLEMDKISETNGRSESEAPSTSCVRNLDFSPEELRRVLQHYGLKYPEEREPPATARDYFGACRLWPREIIYYRKLKKGPISFENYARRVSQNKEFGIVDKYIRSSSGWGQLTQDQL
ncbi:hypothetical protein AKJ16_DCAP05028 [Drosera capensis]